MPTLNSQQGAVENPGYRPEVFDIPQPGSVESEIGNREGEHKANPETASGHSNKDIENPEIARQKILQQMEGVSPAANAQSVEGDPVAKKLLADMVNGVTSYDDANVAKIAKEMTDELMR